ncbi:MAG: hypothetical protein CMM58_12035 [Rhodospirillaceae bacterium]|nr:hypothetical protein [Rhodospirillaceae bacterium]|tara:strand:- start:1987 stop:3000 length:1014 start_codon:yes stop_codon:yes gene_type:complete
MKKKSHTPLVSVIPIIDLLPLSEKGMAGANFIARQLREALTNSGFLIIINHGISRRLIDQTFEEARRFHSQPMHVKQSVLMNSHNNGYMAMNRYNVKTSRVSDEEAKFDLNEAFFIKRERKPDDPLVREGRRFAGPNEWPTGLTNFKKNILEYTDAVDKLAKSLLQPLAISLDMPTNTFEDAFWESQFSFRLSHYPPTKRRDKDQYGIAPHTDANFLTFLAQSTVPGLQIQTADNKWIDIPYVPDSFVVNSGDMLHRWTNGYYRSTPHRALPPKKQSRYAIPYFYGPHLDAQITCLPSCQSKENPAKFPPISYSDYIDWWYDANYNASDQQDLSISG